jgi:hypothetical protein
MGKPNSACPHIVVVGLYFGMNSHIVNKGSVLTNVFISRIGESWFSLLPPYHFGGGSSSSSSSSDSHGLS